MFHIIFNKCSPVLSGGDPGRCRRSEPGTELHLDNQTRDHQPARALGRGQRDDHQYALCGRSDTRQAISPQYGLIAPNTFKSCCL